MMKVFFGMQINIEVDNSQACPKHPKLEVCISLQYLQKNVGMNLIVGYYHVMYAFRVNLQSVVA